MLGVPHFLFNYYQIYSDHANIPSAVIFLLGFSEILELFQMFLCVNKVEKGYFRVYLANVTCPLQLSVNIDQFFSLLVRNPLEASWCLQAFPTLHCDATQ